MEFIILLSAMAALGWALLRSPALSFRQVYLPALMLAPATYQLKIHQLPELTFDRAAVLGVAMVALLVEPLAWRFTILDGVVTWFVAAAVAAEFCNNGVAPAQSLLFFLICTAIIPYALAKRYLGGPPHAELFAKTMVLLLAAIAAISIVEFRLGFNVFRHGWGLLFPGQGDRYIFVQYRWGYGRISGPFEHAIFCGMAMGCGIALQTWLSHAGKWTIERRAQWITAALLAGLLMTLSRGPWLAAAIGIALASAPRIRRGWWTSLRWVLLLSLLSATAFVIGRQYAAQRGTPWSAEDQLSIDYRANLFERYEPIVKARPVWGYGTITWPKAPGMRSVDNEYLQLALSYGLMGLVPFLMLILLSVSRLLRVGLHRPGDGLPWALLGIVTCFAVNLTSVFLGNQLWPLFFVFAGWGEAVIAAARPIPEEEAEPSPALVPRWAPLV